MGTGRVSRACGTFIHLFIFLVHDGAEDLGIRTIKILWIACLRDLSTLILVSLGAGCRMGVAIVM